MLFYRIVKERSNFATKLETLVGKVFERDRSAKCRVFFTPKCAQYIPQIAK